MQIVQRRLPRLDIQRDGLFRLVKADRQDDPVQILGLAKDLVRQDAEIAPRLAQDMPHHQAIQNTIRMVRDQDQRPGARNVRQAPAHHVQRQAIALHHHLPEITARRDLLLIARRPLDQANAAGQVFHRADHGAAPAGLRRVGIADVTGHVAFWRISPSISIRVQRFYIAARVTGE